MTVSPSITAFPVSQRWTLHSYYTLSPYAPDGSGRILAAGADLDAGVGEVLVLSGTGEVLDRFGSRPLQTSFYHTAWWQTWSADAKYVYYQAGSLSKPQIARRELATGQELVIDGDMEGAPAEGPILSGLLGMLYAAGYGDNQYKPDQAPVPFQQRDRHGVFSYDLPQHASRLELSVEKILEHHPERDRIHASDREVRARWGESDGLTLMAYCLRWSPDGSRFLFYFGNHSAPASRGEPRISYVMTSDRSFDEVNLAVDLSYDRRGLHWSWQPDSTRLIGYGPDPDDASRSCVAEVDYTGSGYRKISGHASGGHVSASHADDDVIVTDEGTRTGGAVVFLSRGSGEETARIELPKFVGEREPAGRNAGRVCHHPVFNIEGNRILSNTLPNRNATLVEFDVPAVG